MRVEQRAWQTLLETQAGVVRRDQTALLGWTGSGVRHALSRSWQRLLPGVYLTVTGTPTWEQRAWAGLLYAGERSSLTSWSGLAAWSLADERDDVHVALPHSRRRKPTGFLTGDGSVVLHRTTRSLESRRSLPALPVERCVVDACLGMPWLDDVRAVVSRAVQQGRTTVDKLVTELEAAPQQGSGHLRQALAEVAAGARSAPEAALVSALRRLTLPPYRLNGDVHDDRGRWLARPDVVFDQLKLAIEVDGQRWHLSAESWVADVERHTRLEAAGWTVLRYPASRVLRDAAGVAAEVVAVVARLQAQAA